MQFGYNVSKRKQEQVKGMSYQIAIDGPAGAGKSTVARAVAKKLGYIYVDTGAMYRAMALYLLRLHISSADADRISEASRDAVINIAYENGVQQVFLNGENVTAYLRTEEVGNMASASSVNPDVRRKLVELQQAAGVAQLDNTGAYAELAIALDAWHRAAVPPPSAAAVQQQHTQT